MSERLVATYRLWREVQNHFPKKSRYTLGSKIDDTFVEALELIFTATYLPRDKKLLPLQKAMAKADLLKFLLRVAWEVKDIDNKKYAVMSEPLDEIGKMLGGWLRNVQNETPASKK